MCICAYVLIVNFDVGGLTSLSHLFFEIQADLMGLIPKFYRVAQDMSAAKQRLIDPFSSFLYACLIPVAALFIFEIPYIFAYNWFQHGSLMWPFYYWELQNGWSREFIRNIGIPPIALFLSWWLLYFPRKIVFKPRTKYAMLLILFTILFWVIWIIMPHTAPQTPESLGLPTANWTFPAQQLFPQTIYDYYLNVTVNQPYESVNQNGWWQNDPPVRFINVLTKYMVFITLTYICCITIRKKENDKT
jgi:hypothetical protein